MIRIDMSMPTNCFDCPACNEYLTCAIPINGRKWKAKDVRKFDQGRPEWCPMEEEEQEAVEPKVIRMNSFGYPVHACGKCGHSITESMNYCNECGKRIKWEGR